MSALIALALAAPWLALLGLARPRTRTLGYLLTPLPLLLLALGGDAQLHAPRLLLDSAFAVDPVNRPLLLLAGVGWLLAGSYASGAIERAPVRFGCFWLLTLAGQAIVLLAADLASFYTGYAVMTLAAYGLVVHHGSAEAWRAGRVYLVLSLAGEMAILAGLLMLGAAFGNARFDTLDAELVHGLGAAPWLLLAGFAVKLGIVPLHVWLPLAHPVAPVPASAVLSGLVVKAGLLGLLRLLPAHSLPAVEALLALGLFTAAYGAAVGLAQTRLKTVLAYSTVSQMGLVLAGFAALQAGAGHAAALAALGLFALHHGLNKIALFLAAGHRLQSRLAHALFLLPALALAGLPLTAGALAKDALKQSFTAVELDGWLLAVSLSSALTTALLLHAYRLGCAQTGGRATVHPAWLGAVVAGLLLPWLWAPLLPSLPSLWSGLWPLLLGAAGYLLGRRLLHRRRLTIPEGDLLLPIERLAARLLSWLQQIGQRWHRWQPQASDLLPTAARLARLERALLQVPVVGLGLLAVLLGLWLMLEVPGGS
jgi:formate hydrogenlyase subunit 3/multisubunit Na+/H+ antiporter MnhD subunit